MQKFSTNIGVKYILLIIIAEVAMRYFFFAPFGVLTSLYNYEFILLILASVAIAAGGHYLYTAEKSAGKMSTSTAQNVFVGCNILGVGIGFYLSNALGVPFFTAIFIIASALIYSYVHSLRNYAVIGNLILSLLAVLPIFVVAIYDLVPLIDDENRQFQLTYFSILVDYAVFVFLINWMRQLVKDQINLNTDYKTKRSTLPLLLGRKRSKYFLLALNTAVFGLLLLYSYTYLIENLKLLLGTLTGLVVPVLIIFYLILKAEQPREYKIVSKFLFAELVLTAVSLSFYQFLL